MELYLHEIELLERDLLSDPNVLVTMRELNERKQALQDKQKT